MRTLRLLLTGLLAVVLVPLAATSASAAPPANDEPAGAVALNLGDRVVQNTTQATTTAQDTALNANCGAPATNASVWYKYTAGADGGIFLDVTRSDYSAGMLVFAGAPTADSLVACGPGIVALRARAGRTYNIMVFSDTDVIGGRLVLSLKPAPPRPTVHVIVAKRGLAYRGGAAKIHGKYFCNHGDFAALFGVLVQRAGRLKIPSDFAKEIQCDGRRHYWSAQLVSATGTYAPGRARAKVVIRACGLFQCSQGAATRQIHLVRAGRPPSQLSAVPSTSRFERLRPLVQRQRHWPNS